MEKIKRLINCIIPVTYCNFNCEYCYVPHINAGEKRNPNFMYSPQYIALALSKERLGGTCLFNICGNGETLIPKEVPEIVHEILKQGHYVELVTNGTLTNRIEQIIKSGIGDGGGVKRLEFKFSFHYLQLKEKNLLTKFFDNVKFVRKYGCSYTVELVPHDSLVPYIEEIREVCMRELGGMCHLTVARNEKENKKLLTEMSLSEYVKTWKVFDSEMFDFKLSTFAIKRYEYCYAGDWALLVDLETGITKQCYWSNVIQNIFQDINKPIRYVAMGKKCKLPYCLNAHAHMTLGIIPECATISYDKMRNRINEDKSEWIQPEFKEFIGGKLMDNNTIYNQRQKSKNLFWSETYQLKRVLQHLKRLVKSKDKK